MPRVTQSKKNQKKIVYTEKEIGKINPKSKKISNVVANKNFVQDQFHSSPNIIQEKKHNSIAQINFNSLSPLQRIPSQNDKTQKKPTLSHITQTNEEQTIIRNKKLKSIGPKSKRNEYVYIVDPQSQKMKKYLIHQGEDINYQLNNKQEYVPPFQSCDQDCESTEQIVRKGVEYSKKDLINEVERRNRLMTLRLFNNSKRSQKTQSSSDSESPGK